MKLLPIPMIPIKVQQAEIGGLAAMILNDIRQRGLRPGDRYLNGPELAKHHGVSLTMANRAMQLLARQNILLRRQRAGTFIGEAAANGSRNSPIKCIHLLMPDSYYRTSRTQLEQTVAGIHSELPDSAIQYTFLPRDGELAFVRQLVEQAGNGALQGMVLHLSSPEVQAYFNNAGVPAVVFGSVFPDIKALPWIDRDQEQIGCLLTKFLLAEGHRRMCVLMRDRWGYGDNLFLDGVQQTLATSRAGISLSVRSLPPLSDMAAGSLRPLFANPQPPTALICRSAKLASVAAEVARETKLRVGRDLEIVVAESSTEFPCAEPQVPQEEQGAAIARMLKQLGHGAAPEPNHILIPVAFNNARKKSRRK